MVSRAGTLVALDIETTGLDPKQSRVRAAAVAGAEGQETLVLTSNDEAKLLRELEESVHRLPLDAIIATWNGEEFDMPFLAFRFGRLAVQSTLRVMPMQSTGKYGGLLYRADWGGRSHLDIAPHFQKVAQTLQVPWNLKPIARAVLGADPVEVDRSGSAISRLDPDRLGAYVASDAEITLALAKRLVRNLVLA